MAMPRFLRDTSRNADVSPSTPASVAAAPSSAHAHASPASSSASSSADAELSMAEELQRRKTAFLAHFKSGGGTGTAASVPAGLGDDAAAPPASWASSFLSQRSLDATTATVATADSKCHVRCVVLGYGQHRCRNCGQAVCGVHSKNQVPLPHLGLMKEVRVCDLCTRQLVQRRAGYRSPKKRVSRLEAGMNGTFLEGGESEPEL
ncbi:hypothetical protein BBJ28_00023838, partial [Nothophytophthora sp. Chile5]